MTAAALEVAVRARIAELGGGDDAEERALFAELLTSFAAGVPAALQELRAALAHGDPERLERAAHALKGSAANLGVEELAAQCDALEARGRRGDVGGPRHLPPALLVAADQACDVLGRVAAALRPGRTPRPWPAAPGDAGW